MTLEVIDLQFDRDRFPIAVEARFTDADDALVLDELDNRVPVGRPGFVSIIGLNADDR